MRRNTLSIPTLSILAILVLAVVVRLFKINTPLADWHSWRQSDTASVTREFVKHGVNLLHPQYHDLSSIPSGLDNPEGYRMVEFPIVNALTAVLYQLSGSSTEIHIFSRYVSIVFSLGSVLLIYLISQQFYSQKTALLSAAIFAFLPYNVYYSRSILPEVAAVTMSLCTIYATIRFLRRSSLVYALCIGLSAALALLIKPTAIFLLLPLPFLIIETKGFNQLKRPIWWIIAFLSITPLLVWRTWITQFPAGIPASSWLLNGDSIRFKGSFFHWIFAERIARLILGFWGLILFGMGIINRQGNLNKHQAKHHTWFFHLLLLSCFLYLIVFATGNVRHDYYQILIIPALSFFVARGIVFLLDAPKKYNYNLVTCYLLLLTCVSFMVAFSWFEVRGFYNINNPAIVEAGKALDLLVPPDALVIAPYQGDTAFLYQTNRRGWPIGGNLEDKIDQGAQYYVSVNYDDETNNLISRCKTVSSTTSYALINIQECANER